MGLAYRHSEKSNTLQENTSKEYFFGQIIFPFVSKRQKTNSSLIIKLFPSNVDFYLWWRGVGGGVEVEVAWSFTNPRSLNVEAAVVVPITAIRKKKILFCCASSCLVSMATLPH